MDSADIRYRITGTLHTHAPLRVGSGSPAPAIWFQEKAEDTPLPAAPLLLDHLKRPCIPGSTLKGFLRARLAAASSPGDGLDALLFGEGGHEGRKGRLAVGWAYLDQDTPTVPRTGVAIEPVRGTAQAHHLYAQDWVPEGVEFRWTLAFQGSPEQLERMLALLESLDGALDCHLGHGASGLQGRVSFCLTQLERQELWPPKDRLEDTWIKVTRPTAQHPPFQISPADRLPLGLTLHLDAPFLVHDPAHARKSEERHEDGKCALACTRDAHGRPRLPWRSLRGLFRSCARRILQTLLHARTTDPVPESAEATRLLALLFGAEGQRGRLRLGDAACTAQTFLKRTFLPVDRFLGAGASAGKEAEDHADAFRLYDAETADPADLHTEGFLDLAGLSETDRTLLKTLLYFVLRDGQEGDLALGWGSARGLGAFRLALDGIENLAAWLHPDPAQLLQALCIGSPDPGSKPDLGRPCEDALPVSTLVPGPNAFHPPYLFLPLKAPRPTVPWLNDPQDWARTSATGDHPARHDTYLPGTFSGRILCTLTTCTPTFVGAQRRDQGAEQPARHEPYRVGGQIALPGSSLRGMVASLAEALSRSALRVLQDRPYSVRKPPRKPISAQGILRKTPDGWAILPLTLPVTRNRQPEARWMKAFHLSPSSPRTDLPYPIPLPRAGIQPKILKAVGYFCSPSLGRGQRADLATLHPFSPTDPPCARGVLRVLAASPEIRTAMPSARVRKHELFLPYPPKAEARQLVPLAPGVLEAYQRAGFVAGRKQEDAHRLGVTQCLGDNVVCREMIAGSPLEDGMVVCFDVDPAGNRVTEVSLSMIWRKAVDATAHGFFSGVSPDLIPFTVPGTSTGRTGLTPAELLFGFVAQGKTQGDRMAPALKGRVTFSDAYPCAPPRTLKARTLRILSAPKPPSPGMYFTRQGNAFIAKTDLALAQEHQPRGRKVYLHHVRPGESLPEGHWVTASHTEAPGQKVEIEALAADNRFQFHVDFHNLSLPELQLLLTALRPSPAFWHRLGQGKPLGLGSVDVQPEALLLVDRTQRYTRLEPPRWAWVAHREGASPSTWLPRYQAEALASPKASLVWHPGHLVDADALAQVCRLGEPQRLAKDVPVVPVLLEPSALQVYRRGAPHESTEKETFRAYGQTTPLPVLEAPGDMTPFMIL